MSDVVAVAEVAGAMPEMLVVNGVEYRRVAVCSTAADRASDAGVKRAFTLAVGEKLARGESWTLDDVAKAKGCSISTVRKDVGGLLQELPGRRRKRGRKVFLTARSVAKYLGYAVEAARLA